MINKRNAEKLEDIILGELKNGPQRVSKLIIAISRRRPGTTKQGVYAALRSLRTTEKVVTHHGFASLSNVWITQMLDFFSAARRNYMNAETRDEGFLNLSEGEKAVYFFRDPVQTDAFWSHAFTILNNTVSPDKALYLYNPHDWFILARSENEIKTIKDVVRRGRGYNMVVGHEEPLDSFAAKEIRALGAEYRIADRPLFRKDNYYVNIFGDFLIEAYLDEKVAEKIRDFYKTNNTWSEDERHRLVSIVNARGRSKLVISCNARKAAKLTAMLKGAGAHEAKSK